MKITTGALVVLVLITGVLLYRDHSQQVQSLPTLTMTDINGREISLKELKGHAALVSFWSISCAICMDEIEYLQALHDKHGQNDFKVVAINMPYDPPNLVLDLVKKRSIAYAVVLDINNELGQAFGGIDVTPTTFLIGLNGQILSKTQGELDHDEISSGIEKMLQEG